MEKCSICNQVRVRYVLLKDGRRVCEACRDLLEEEENDAPQIQIKLPNDLVAFWVGTVSKIGWNKDRSERRRIFEVPSNQRPMIEFDTDYLIVIKRMPKKEDQLNKKEGEK